MSPLSGQEPGAKSEEPSNTSPPQLIFMQTASIPLAPAALPAPLRWGY